MSNAYFSLAISEIISHFQSLVLPFAYCPLVHTSPFNNNSTFLLKKNFKFVC